MKDENDMKNQIAPPTSQNTDLKNTKDHIRSNPRATKELPSKGDLRSEVRQEHTNHFTNREGYPEKK
jgi:hypothetical protein